MMSKVKRLTVQDKLNLARRHLSKVQSAWMDPLDFEDLSIYGFYCLEAAVEAAARHVQIETKKQHWQKANAARDLHERYGLPDLADLLVDLNDTRKSVVYGDVVPSEIDEEDVVIAIENYVEAVEQFVGMVGRPH